MNKRIFISLLLVLCLCTLCACTSEKPSIEEKPKLYTVIEDDTEYIVHTESMIFGFAKYDFDKADILNIVNEAVLIMEDVGEYLGVECAPEEWEIITCHFDSEYQSPQGDGISEYLCLKQAIYCTDPGIFVHEYVHALTDGYNKDLVYSPSALYIEGLAQYVGYNFYDCIASREYVYFKELTKRLPDPWEHQKLCDMLSANELPYSGDNYCKALVAFMDKYQDYSTVDKTGHFYKYYISHVFVDYCVNYLGGIEKFMSVYNDNVTVADVYGKSVDELVLEACDNNYKLFFEE